MTESDDTEKLPPFVVRDGDGYHYRWKTELCWGAVFILVIYCVIPTAMHFIFGMPLRWWVYAGYSLQLASFVIANQIKRRRDLRAGRLKSPWYRLGLLELVVLMTGMAMLFACLSTQIR